MSSQTSEKTSNGVLATPQCLLAEAWCFTIKPQPVGSMLCQVATSAIAQRAYPWWTMEHVGKDSFELAKLVVPAEAPTDRRVERL